MSAVTVAAKNPTASVRLTALEEKSALRRHATEQKIVPPKTKNKNGRRHKPSEKRESAKGQVKYLGTSEASDPRLMKRLLEV